MGCGLITREVNDSVAPLLASSSLVKKDISQLIKKTPFRDFSCAELMKLKEHFTVSYVDKMNISQVEKSAFIYFLEKDIPNKTEFILLYLSNTTTAVHELKREWILTVLKSNSSQIAECGKTIASWIVELFYFYFFAQVFLSLNKMVLYSIVQDINVTPKNIFIFVEFVKEELSKIEEFELTVFF